MSTETRTWSPQQAAAHNRLDLSGQRFGRLVVTEFAFTNNSRKSVWRCTCDCGTAVEVPGFRLRSGHTSSCGCLQREVGDANLAAGHRQNFVHGWVGTPTYKSWDSAKQRCFNPNDDHYDRYGGRGITMCMRWRRSFKAFLADMGERPEGMTLDRINNDGHYEPGNCRWATGSEQSSNRKNPWITRRANEAAAEKITVVM